MTETKINKQRQIKIMVKKNQRKLILSLLLILILAGIFRLAYQGLKQEWQKYKEMNTFKYQIK